VRAATRGEEEFIQNVIQKHSIEIASTLPKAWETCVAGAVGTPVELDYEFEIS
jgi:hypothetical protein